MPVKVVLQLSNCPFAACINERPSFGVARALIAQPLLKQTGFAPHVQSSNTAHYQRIFVNHHYSGKAVFTGPETAGRKCPYALASARNPSATSPYHRPDFSRQYSDLDPRISKYLLRAHNDSGGRVSWGRRRSPTHLCEVKPELGNLTARN